MNPLRIRQQHDTSNPTPVWLRINISQANNQCRLFSKHKIQSNRAPATAKKTSLLIWLDPATVRIKKSKSSSCTSVENNVAWLVYRWPWTTQTQRLTNCLSRPWCPSLIGNDFPGGHPILARPSQFVVLCLLFDVSKKKIIRHKLAFVRLCYKKQVLQTTPAGQILSAKPFHPAREAILSVMKN